MGQEITKTVKLLFEVIYKFIIVIINGSSYGPKKNYNL